MKAIEYTLKATKQKFKAQNIKSSVDAVSFAKNFYHDDILIYESAFIILMNAKHDAIGYAKISQGGVCGTVIDPKIIAKYVIDSLAVSIIIVHNHPSGNLNASPADISMAKRMKEVLPMIDARLSDSIIITDNGYYSMVDEGVL